MSGYYDEELGYYLWDGEGSLTIGVEGRYLYQIADAPIDLLLTTQVLPGEVYDGTYQIYDYYGGGISIDFQFNTIIFSDAAEFEGSDITDVVFGSAQADALGGGAGNDFIESGFGDDVLDGGEGADALYGEGGNDIYVVDQASDQVFEAIGGGRDVVTTDVS
ncbi:calcium-binding protein, partial [Methylobacterium sp. Leaf118]|uniref:calcium-binding protein n=1 Tax=Methylobacterium sp. Leaf118 TaxID=2876562 RepID=UPI003FA54756